MAVGGGSAERRADDLASTGDPAALAWAAGAEGERRVAAALAHMPEAWTVLHDRLLRPGRSEANLDHVVVGPSGVFLVDAKNRAGRVVAWDGGLFQHTSREGTSRNPSLAGELAKVHGMAAHMAGVSGMPVTPVLCLAGAHEAEFGEPQLLRGVWVVPVSRLVPWLQARPHMHERGAVQRLATRAMTDFPSTTTHPELLAAMGADAAAPPRPPQRRSRNAGTRRPTTVGPQRRPAGRRRGRYNAMRGGVSLVLLGLAVLWALPALAHFAAARAKQLEIEGLPTRPAPVATSAHGVRAAVPGPGGEPLSPGRAAGTQPLSPTDCSRATGTEITRIIGRRIYPVAVISGCAWGTRLDDTSTVVVSITMSAEHAPFDFQFETSARQSRVVYGGGYDPQFRPATSLWVAKGAPLSVAGSGAVAVADIQVKVSREMLSLSEDQARRMALAIAKAANT